MSHEKVACLLYFTPALWRSIIKILVSADIRWDLRVSALFWDNLCLRKNYKLALHLLLFSVGASNWGYARDR